MIKKRADAIGHAVDGLCWAMSTQVNYRIHIFLIICTIIGGVLFNLTSVEWLIVLIVIVLGLVIETINTAVEELGDAVTEEYNLHIKRAKDVSAGAMLLYAIGSVCIAALIFVPHIFSLFMY